jgi:uncharacterized protein YycO
MPDPIQFLHFSHGLGILRMKQLYYLRYLVFVLILPVVRNISRVNWRLGRPYKCSSTHLDPVRKFLHPGMIILSHKNYELTNLFIRGYFTHAAMVIHGDYIVEAVSEGVVRRQLSEFIGNVDDFIILEPRFCTRDSMLEAGEFVERSVGYRYNFTFRSGRKAFYCSELVYRAYSETHGWNHVKNEYPREAWDFDPWKIMIPQNLLESEMLWHVVRS